MSKTKIIIIASAVVAVAVLTVLGIKFAGKSETDVTTDTATTTAQNTTVDFNNLPIGDYTTIKPFVDAQTEILTPTTSKAPVSSAIGVPETTKEHEEYATRVDSVNGWKDNELTEGLPKIRTSGISTFNDVTDKGNRTIIRINNFDYSSYLDYVDKLEAAGFTDNNNRAHIPSTAPSTVAMFYSKYDGERSFGVYWYGDSSSAGFDCEIVISNYDQAK
ncbi:MAG: hypothetical protein IKK37_00265 [Clostridia bacterium]|nr:hypothetical protein [Clostridia bacterium]